jgi:hypothetical protein
LRRFQGRPANGGVFGVIEQQPEAIQAFQHIGHGLILAHSLAMLGMTASDIVLQLVERSDTQYRLVDDRRTPR